MGNDRMVNAQDRPIGYGRCFECDTSLLGPYCGKCNPPTAPVWQWLLVMLIGGGIGSFITMIFS